MSGEITGHFTNITCDPLVTGTNTVAVWKTRVNAGGYFVKVNAASTTPDEIGVAFLVGDDKYVMGRLVGYTGTGAKFKVTVETKGVYGTAEGGGTGAWAATDYGDRMKADSDGKLIVDNSQTDGNVIVVGGTKPEPKVAWDWFDRSDS